MSLPSRERGLKLSLRGCLPVQHGSLPSRERGLKCLPGVVVRLVVSVAPFTGAWIEMMSCTGTGCSTTSLPSRERGLKSRLPCPRLCWQAVAPFTGAWIEIMCPIQHVKASKSLPSRERGLKLSERGYPMSSLSRSLHGSVD